MRGRKGRKRRAELLPPCESAWRGLGKERGIRLVSPKVLSLHRRNFDEIGAAVADAFTGSRLQLLVETHIDSGQVIIAATHRQVLGFQLRIRPHELLFQFPRGDGKHLPRARKSRRDLHGFKRMPQLSEVRVRIKAAARSMRCPLMSDQSSVGHDVRNSRRIRESWRVRTILCISFCKLRPQPMHDESKLSGHAFWFRRMAVTKLRRPRERQHIIVECAWLSGSVLSLPVTV